MKSSEIKVSVPKRNISLTLVSKDPEVWDDCLELCAGDEKAAVGAFNAGWTVKAQSKVRSDIETVTDPEREGGPMEGDELLNYAQKQLDEFVYTGPRERKAKKKVTISKEQLKAQGIKAADLKQMDKLFALLEEKGISVVD